MKVFLGGTCNDSKWRDHVMKNLKMDYFNPVVEDWTPECQAEEIKQRAECDWVLYVISPVMTGVYSIAEAVDDSNKRPSKTIFCYIRVDGGKAFYPGQCKSLNMVANMVIDNGGRYFRNLESVVKFLNEEAAHGKT